MTTSKKTAGPSFEDELALSKRIIKRFIESCSHDLKSPLCSIEGLATIASKQNTVDEVREYLAMIGQCVDRMKRTLISLEEYNLHLQRELRQNEISADKLIGKILDENADNIRECGVGLAVDVNQRVKWISDECFVYIILKNVIRNAVAFSDRKKATRKVSIDVAVNERFAGIRISDNGIGISAAQQTRLYEPFHRASNLESGLGLGLFMVKGLVNKLPANIGISSQEGVGTTVSLVIPNNIAI